MDNKIIEQRLLELEARVSKLEEGGLSPCAGSATTTQKKISAKEFLMKNELKSEAQKTLALGYYLEYVEGVSSFNIDDLVSVLQAAKEKRPKNINDMVNKNIGRGLLMEAAEKKDSKKAWVLTSTGEKYVEKELIK